MRRGRTISKSATPAERRTPTGSPRTTRTLISLYDPAKCIVCSRCVRACEEVQGTFALTIEGRGFDSRVSAGMAGDNFLSSDCVSCGACVQACPTGTLQEKSVIDIGTPDTSIITTCAYCGVGCSFKAEMRGDELVRMTPTSTARPTAAIPASRAASPMAMPPTRTASCRR
ncbi:MAG: 4Fe-4S dicluster domain-containing protein [Paracoccaceae bacterium]